MPDGKPAGITCVNLERETGLCTIWGTPAYPEVCRHFTATEEFCGQNREEAIERLIALEEATKAETETKESSQT